MALRYRRSFGHSRQSLRNQSSAVDQSRTVLHPCFPRRQETEHRPGGRSSVDPIAHITPKGPTLPLPSHPTRSFPNRPTGGTASAPPTTYDGLRSLRIGEPEYDGPPEAPKCARSVYSASSHGAPLPSFSAPRPTWQRLLPGIYSRLG
jgi:hypothetical protein